MGWFVDRGPPAGRLAAPMALRRPYTRPSAFLWASWPVLPIGCQRANLKAACSPWTKPLPKPSAAPMTRAASCPAWSSSAGILLPKIAEQVRAWDLASSVKGDWTVGLKLARCYLPDATEQFVITDIVRFRGPPEEVRATVKAVAQADGYATKI